MNIYIYILYILSVFSTIVLSFIHSYVSNHNQSTHNPQSIHTQPTITVDTTPYSIKRCLCHIIFCNYKCLNIGLFPNSDIFYSSICNQPTKFLQADGGLSLRATHTFSVSHVICDKVSWPPRNLSAPYYKTANSSDIGTEW